MIKQKKYLVKKITGYRILGKNQLGYGVVNSRGGGVLPYKRLLGMCHWMGSHFHDWIDYNGVAFLVELLEWGRTFSGFLG